MTNWLIYFHPDEEEFPEVFNNEQQARERYAKLLAENWKCRLFVEVTPDQPSEAP